MRSPRVGIVGAGLMGRWHADAAIRSGATLAAVVDPRRAEADDLARRHKCRGVHERVDALWDAPPLDVLHVCAPLSEHAAIVEAALAAGAHLLVEKPLAPDAEATERLLTLASERNRLLCPVHQYPFQDGFRDAHDWIRASGRFVHAVVTLCSAGAVGRSGDAAEALLAEMLPHPLSVFRRLAPDAFATIDWEASRPATGEMRLRARVGEATMEAFLSLAARPTESSLVVRAEDGTAHVDFFHGYAFVEGGEVSRGRKIGRPFTQSLGRLRAATRNLSRRVLRREPAYPGLRPLVRAFYAAIDGEGPNPVSAAETREVARARDRILRGLGVEAR